MTARALAFDADPSYTADDVQRILGVSLSFAYEVMHKMEHEKLGRAIRVRRSVFEQWRKEQTKCASPSTNEERSGGFADPKGESRSAARRGTPPKLSPSGSETGGNASSPIRPITPRTARRSRAQQSGG